MVNLQTVLSVYDDKVTLMQWLKKVEKALKDSVLVSVDAENVDETHAVFTFNFEDGSKIISPAVLLPRGPKGDTGASVHVLPSAEACTQVGDGYIDAETGHLIVLTALDPRTFVDCGLIRGPTGSAGITPHIDIVTGNWFIGDIDTGVHAQGPAGQTTLYEHYFVLNAKPYSIVTKNNTAFINLQDVLQAVSSMNFVTGEAQNNDGFKEHIIGACYENNTVKLVTIAYATGALNKISLRALETGINDSVYSY